MPVGFWEAVLLAVLVMVALVHAIVNQRRAVVQNRRLVADSDRYQREAMANQQRIIAPLEMNNRLLEQIRDASLR